MKYFNPNDQGYIDAKLKDLFEAKCDICGTNFKRTKKFYYHRLYHNTFYTAPDTCSPECIIQSHKTGKTIQCKQCNKDIYVTKKSLEKQINHFCGTICAGIYNNNGINKKIHSPQTKQKISNSLKKYMELNPDISQIQRDRLYYYSQLKKISARDNPKRPKRKYIKAGNPKRSIDKLRYIRQYEENPSFCNICKILLPYDKRHRKTCGSKHCLHTSNSQGVIKYLKSPNRKIRGNGKQSYMEETFEKWLNETLNIKKGHKGYLTEIRIYNKETGKNGFCDFVFPQKRLIIELDGSHHIKRKHLDDIRDNHLNSRGWKVYRITIKEYYKKTKVEEVISLLKGTAGGNCIPINTD